MGEILLSIIIPVYNHEKYIKECIDSVLKQNIDFEYDVWIGDDCSKDSTREVLREIEKYCPDNFHFIYREQNIFPNNAIDMIAKSTGKYVCVLEGDDYWLYENKLRTQVKYLEEHPECVATFHDCIIVNENSEPNGEVYPTYKGEFYTLKAYEKGFLPGQTATCVVRRNYYDVNEYFIENYKLYDFYPGDRRKMFLILFLGEVKIYDEKWSAYRHITNNGSSFSATYVRNTKTRKDEVLFYKSLKNFSKDKNNKAAYDVVAKKYYNSYLRKCMGKNKIFALKDFWKEVWKEKKCIKYLFAALADSCKMCIKKLLKKV